MSPKARNRWLTFAAVIPAAVAVLGLMQPASHVLAHHCVTVACVSTDTFAVYQEGAARIRERDSLNTSGQFARIDTSLAQLVRACQRRGECP